MGMGGACAMLISIVEFNHLQLGLSHIDWNEFYKLLSPSGYSIASPIPIGELLIIALGMIIGGISFAGSIIAWGKLNGKIKDRSFGAQQLINVGLLLLILAVTGLLPVYGRARYRACSKTSGYFLSCSILY